MLTLSVGDIVERNDVLQKLVDMLYERSDLDFKRGTFRVKGDTIEIMKPDGRNVLTKVISLTTEDGTAVTSAPHPKQVLYAQLDESVEKYDLLRVKG